MIGGNRMSVKRKSILEMSSMEARLFLLKSSSYVDMLLPEYFDFQPVIDYAQKILADKKLSSLIRRRDLKEAEFANHTILLNKNAGYDWRPVQIIHPLLYVDLVNLITTNKNWNILQERFKVFQGDKRIQCISIPVESMGTKNDKAETILNWWEGMEQNSIVKSLQYSYCIRTDITNCYGSIYTHSIDWAIRGKSIAKNAKSHKDTSLGHMIDWTVEQLQCGQTNGIPQGGVLFNFIAEIVLGYSDFLLSEKLNQMEVSGWSVIRYRDDYRIFSNSKETAELVVKVISDVLSDLNMHFNSSKTGMTSQIIESAIKPDKVYWNAKIPVIMPIRYENGVKKFDYQLNLQKHLLEILWLSKKFQNSGSVIKALTAFTERLDGLRQINEPVLPLISIVADLISNNPKVIPIGVGVMSKLLTKEYEQSDDVSAGRIVSLITNKLESTPNLNFLDVWLQRLTVLTDISRHFSEKLCLAVSDLDYDIWDSSFVSAKIKFPSIVNREKLKKLRVEIPTAVFDIFNEYD